MLTRDTYIAILEKRAAEERMVDNQDVAHDEYAANMDDNRTYLKDIFDNAKSVEQNQTKHVGRLFPGKSKKESGQVLLKVARQLFDAALENVPDGLVKTAEPHYREAAFRSFVSELEKIAALKGQTLSQVAAKNQIAMSRPAKVWSIGEGSGMSGALGAAKKALPEGSGTSAKSPGFFSRMFNR